MGKIDGIAKSYGVAVGGESVENQRKIKEKSKLTKGLGGANIVRVINRMEGYRIENNAFYVIRAYFIFWIC